MSLCEYGCGQEGLFQLKNGKWCCAESWNSCPVIKEKNSRNKIGNIFSVGNKKTYTECVWCGHSTTRCSIKKHESFCTLNPKNFHITSMSLIPCEKCGKCHNGEFGDGRFCSLKCAKSRNFSKEDRDKLSEKLKNDPRCSSILMGRDLKRKVFIDNECECCGLIFQMNINAPKKFCSDKCRLSMAGGMRENTASFRGKSGWYKGYWCDSSWELAFVIYHLDHKIPFVRNKEGFEYEFEGKKHRYYPDFIYEDGTYIEIKGQMSEKDKVKILGFPNTLLVLRKEEMSNMLYYSNRFYKKFVNLLCKNFMD